MSGATGHQRGRASTSASIPSRGTISTPKLPCPRRPKSHPPRDEPSVWPRPAAPASAPIVIPSLWRAEKTDVTRDFCHARTRHQRTQPTGQHRHERAITSRDNKNSRRHPRQLRCSQCGRLSRVRVGECADGHTSTGVPGSSFLASVDAKISGGGAMCRPRRSNVCYVLRSCSRTFLAGYRLVDSKNRHYWAGTGWLARWRCDWSVASWAFQDVCPGWVTLRLGLFKMSALAGSRCVLGFSRCLPWLGHVAAMEEFALQKSYENTRLLG